MHKKSTMTFTSSLILIAAAVFAPAPANALLAPLADARVSAFAAPDDEAAVRAVLDEFSRSIREKDWEAFEALFLDEDTPWVGVIGAAGRERARSFGMLDDDGLYRVSRANFRSQISGMPGVAEETFFNVTIEVADGLALMKADYDFLADGVVQNHGVETWSLVQTDGGWKIVAVHYSLNMGAR